VAFARRFEHLLDFSVGNILTYRRAVFVRRLFVVEQVGYSRQLFTGNVSHSVIKTSLIVYEEILRKDKRFYTREEKKVFCQRINGLSK
jgi:hypothetical protein